jgi:predicted Zn-dependent peptidase
MRPDRQELLGEEVLSVTLKQGCSLWLLPQKKVRQKVALLDVECGSLHRGPTSNAPKGIAHFIEHCLFEKLTGDITDRFTALGGDVNASTSFTSTQYTLNCSDNLCQQIDLLFELVFSDFWTSAGIAKERDVITSEIHLYQDDADWGGYKAALHCAYGEHEISAEIAGREEDLAVIDENTLRSWHQAYYRPENMNLFLSGDIEIDAIVETCEQAIARHFISSEAISVPVLATVPILPTVKRGIVREFPISHSQLFVVYADRRVEREGRPLLERELALELLLDIAFGPASAAYSEWYERGLISGDSFSADVYTERLFSFCMLSAETPDPQLLSEEIDRVLGDMAVSGQWQQDLSRAKRKAYGQIVRSFESVENCVALMQSAVSCGAHPFDYVKICESLSNEGIESCLQDCLRPGGGGVVYIYPHEEIR